MSLGLAVAICLVVAVLMFARVGPLLAERGVVDVPNERTSHVGTTTRGGGIGIASGFAAGMVVFGLSGGWLNWPVETVALAAFALGLVGFGEDLWHLSLGVRLGAQVLIPLLAVVWLLTHGALDLGLAVLCVLAGIFYVNASNFMDGVNGISSFHGIVVALYWLYWGTYFRHEALTAFAVLFGVAFLAFIPWNVIRTRLFMGDSGSYFLGGGVWALSVIGLVLGMPIVVVGAPLVIYSVDVIATLLVRIVQRQPLYLAHKQHVYQRIEQLTGSHMAAAGWNALLTIACALTGWFGYFSGLLTEALLAMFGIAAVYLVSPLVVRMLLGDRSRHSAAEAPAAAGTPVEGE